MASSTCIAVTVSIHPPAARREYASPAVATTISFEARTSDSSVGTTNVAATAEVVANAASAKRRFMGAVQTLATSGKIRHDAGHVLCDLCASVVTRSNSPQSHREHRDQRRN